MTIEIDYGHNQPLSPQSGLFMPRSLIRDISESHEGGVSALHLPTQPEASSALTHEVLRQLPAGLLAQVLRDIRSHSPALFELVLLRSPDAGMFGHLRELMADFGVYDLGVSSGCSFVLAAQPSNRLGAWAEFFTQIWEPSFGPVPEVQTLLGLQLGDQPTRQDFRDALLPAVGLPAVGDADPLLPLRGFVSETLRESDRPMFVAQTADVYSDWSAGAARAGRREQQRTDDRKARKARREAFRAARG